MTDSTPPVQEEKTGSIKLPKSWIGIVLAALVGAGGMGGIGGYVGGGDTKTTDQMASDVREIKDELKAMGKQLGGGELRFQGLDRDIAEMRKELDAVRKLAERRR
jgi:hypothetical protein